MIARTRQPTERIAGSTAAATRWAIRSQLVLLAAIVVCTALMPRFLFSTNMGGVSNYGVHLRTVVPYSLGVVGEVACLLRVAALLRAEHAAGTARTLRTVLLVTCGAIMLNLITTYPYKLNEMWATVHSWSGIALAAVELGGAAVLVRLTTDRTAQVAFTLVVLGFALLALTYVGVLFILFVAESLTAAGSGLLIVRVVRAAAEPAGLRPRRLKRLPRARRPRPH